MPLPYREESRSIPQNHRRMAEIHQSNHTLHFAALDPMSLLISQNLDPDRLLPLQLATDCYMMERGPRYRAYAQLRESKLRIKNAKKEAADHESRLTPPKKQVKFQGNSTPVGRSRGSSVLAQSVPDFSAALRKENRKPGNQLPAVLEMTPPAMKSSKMYSVAAKLGGSKSASAGEKKGGVMARKSYASVEELKGLSSAAAIAINGENKGGRTNNRGIGKTILGCRQY